MGRKRSKNRNKQVDQINQVEIEEIVTKAVDESGNQRAFAGQLLMFPTIVGLALESWWAGLITIVLSLFILRYVQFPITFLIFFVALWLQWGLWGWYMGHALGGIEGAIVLTIVGLVIGYAGNIEEIRDMLKVM